MILASCLSHGVFHLYIDCNCFNSVFGDPCVNILRNSLVTMKSLASDMKKSEACMKVGALDTACNIRNIMSIAEEYGSEKY